MPPIPESLISDARIAEVHGTANFGTTAPRDVVSQALLKVACSYHNGSTALRILLEHGLVSGDPIKILAMGSRTAPKLTASGRSYLWSSFHAVCHTKTHEEAGSEMISDAEIAEALGGADFGVLPARVAINESLLRQVCRYQNGDLVLSIMSRLGLTRDDKYNLTDIGRRYLWACLAN
ncbi:hypothetical protein ACFOY8_14445 [Thalassospira xianhensis]|uniref:Uncharacterized protein n=1 Tax=Thalassospira xianhensis MCCC 1A02616 TaxID=1177929 RepID=A0A367UHG1_9PROT|nr:hypothetical protein [Thalassospira xianhensis]RCK07648.1 hypothetical protein TH5_00805 [Thalassospira xianhensis MCCC 1A02616]